MRTPWIGHSTCRSSRASIGLALVLRPKNVTSTPLVRYWSTSMATCWPFCRASASFSGASRPAGISVPILTARISWMVRSAEAMFGRRYRIAASSPCATAASAGNSQLPRWLAKISAGLPSFLSWANNSWVRGENFDAAFLGMIDVVVPDMVEMGEFGADAAEIVPDASENGLDLLGRFFRKGGGEIGAADLVLTQPWADEA